jgi:hypothetical protein
MATQISPSFAVSDGGFEASAIGSAASVTRWSRGAS